MTKELKLSGNMAIEASKAKVWAMFNLLRNNISLDEFDVVLLLLSLYKDNLFTSEAIDKKIPLSKSLEKQVVLSHNIAYKPYLSIINYFEHTLDKINERGIREILNMFEAENKEVISEKFSFLFDSLLHLVSQYQGVYRGGFFQPVELTRFMFKIAELADNSNVFNPFAGTASFSIYLKKGQNYLGQEINQKTWTLGKLRLMAYGQAADSKFEVNDSILNWPSSSSKFDLIIAIPPTGFNIQHLNIRGKFIHTYKRIEQFLVEKSIENLSAKGKLITIVPQSFLQRAHGEEHILANLIESDLIDTIISLPGGFLVNTGIPISILVINKEKKFKGKVRLINADKYIDINSDKSPKLNEIALLELMLNSSDDDALRIIDNKEIRELNYSLNAPRYFQKEIVLNENEKLVPLSDVLLFIKGDKKEMPKTGKLLRIRDLKDEKIEFQLNVDELEDTELQRNDLNKIEQSCLLVAVRWKSLKPTYFNFTGTPIFRSADVLAFEIDESILDYNYLINELQADYVKEQLDSFRVGSTVPVIRRDELLKVKIKLLSLKEQKAKVKGLHELSDKIKVLQEERNQLAHGVTNKLYESVSSIKHSLGKPLLNIGSSLRNIEKALSRFNAEWENIKLNDRYSLTIKDSFESVHRNLELIHSILKKNESELDLSNYSIENIDFLSFIKGYVKRVKSAEKANVTSSIDIHPDIKDQLKNKVIVQGNIELLEIGLNTIVENAIMHAFIDDTQKYKLDFRLSLYLASSKTIESIQNIGKFDTYIKVEVSNNGKPFPKNYSLEKLIRKNSFAGETGNTGQGGFDLNEIIKYHNSGNSTLQLITNDPTNQFTTTYLFLIPLSQ